MLGLRSLGLEPGADCSIVGMDDTSEGALWQPGLTTISIERASIGEAAGKLLLAPPDDPDRPLERVIIIPARVVRSSTGGAQKVAKRLVGSRTGRSLRRVSRSDMEMYGDRESVIKGKEKY